MSMLSYVMRVICLSFLFAGSTSIIFAALALVNAAKAQGMPVAEAAAANAPMFTMFSVVVLVCAMGLLIAEGLHFAKHRTLSGVVKARYVSSLLCVAAAIVLRVGIIPGMEQLSMHPKSLEAHAAFKQLHEASRVDFLVIIVTALISLLLPGFGEQQSLLRAKGGASSEP